MDFSWSEDQLRLKESVIEFAKNELNSDVIERDKNGHFSRKLWEKCAEFGIQGIPFPAEYGGINADILTTLLVMEGLGYGCKDSGLVFGINAQMWSVQMPILRFGTEAQKEKFLPKLCSGKWIGAHGMTEPGSGSDAFSLQTSAKLHDGYYILNGTKTFVTNAPEADVFIVFATVNKKFGFMGVTAFIIEKKFEGFCVNKAIEMMGLRTVHMAELILEDCKVPVENRLGKEGGGSRVFEDSMEWERSCILASYIGAMERQLETCINYAKVRRQFNKPISKFQSVAKRIVDMKVRMETSRQILYKVAWLKKNKRQAVMDAAIAKLYLSEAWVQSCLDAIQIHGGYGFAKEFELERDLRDSIGGTLYSGTSEIQRNIIAHQLGL